MNEHEQTAHPQQQPALWPLGATAHRLRLSQSFLKEQARKGLIPAQPTGRGQWLFDPDAVTTALRARAGFSADKLNQGVELVQAHELAEMTLFPPKTILEMAAAGTIPHFRVQRPNGLGYLFDPAIVVEVLRLRWVSQFPALPRVQKRKPKAPSSRPSESGGAD